MEELFCRRKDRDEDQEVKGDKDEEKWQFQVVRELTQNNFETTLAGVEHSLVMFYAPCKHSTTKTEYFDQVLHPLYTVCLPAFRMFILNF